MAKKTKAQLQAELNAAKANDTQALEQAPAPTTQEPEAPQEEKKKAPGKIAQILNHFKNGMSTKDIAKQFVLDENGQPIATEEKDAEGNVIYETFHPTTISIQVNKYKKANPDIYPPQPPAKTKAEIAAEKKAAKEAEEAKKEAVASADAAAEKA